MEKELEVRSHVSGDHGVPSIKKEGEKMALKGKQFSNRKWGFRGSL